MENENLITKIAILYYLENLTQDQIGKKFNLSRVTISKYLVKARERKIVKIEIDSNNKEIQLMENELEKKFNLMACKILQNYSNDDINDSDLGKALSEVLSIYLKNNFYIGIGWGTTVKKAISTLKINKNYSNIKIIPTMGSIGQINSELHSNQICIILAEKISGESHLIHAPTIFDNPKTKKVYEEEKVFKDVSKFWNKIDIAILAIGALEMEASLFKYGNLDKELMSYFKGLNIIGDVNMIFIDKEGKPINNKFNDRLLRIPFDILKKINVRIGLAYRKEKSDVIFAALKGNIINVLITDEINAKYLLERN